MKEICGRCHNTKSATCCSQGLTRALKAGATRNGKPVRVKPGSMNKGRRGKR